ncbi:MAG: BsuBI/PstI family type II restriction endonuclease [Terriglobia bacterium]
MKRNAAFRSNARILFQPHAQMPAMQRIPLINSSALIRRPHPGGQNDLMKKIINEFCSRFTPGGVLVYVADGGKRWAYIDADYLRSLGIVVEKHRKMPNVVVHFTKKNWLFLIEAVTSHGPVDANRLTELTSLFAGSRPGLVFVTALLNRRGLAKYLGAVAWGTNVWIASAPDHMIHFDG